MLLLYYYYYHENETLTVTRRIRSKSAFVLVGFRSLVVPYVPVNRTMRRNYRQKTILKFGVLDL